LLMSKVNICIFYLFNTVLIFTLDYLPSNTIFIADLAEVLREVRLSRIDIAEIKQATSLSFTEISATNRRLHNPWTCDFVTSKTDLERLDEFRCLLKAAYWKPISKIDIRLAKCQITNVWGAGSADMAKMMNTVQVKAAHLLPRRTKLDTMTRLDLKEKDINSVRNGLFLLSSIEAAFDTLRLSFVRNPLGRFEVVIWDPVLMDQLLVSTHPKIGTFQTIAHGSLIFETDERPFSRVLSFHAHLAYHHAVMKDWIQGDHPEEPSEFGTPTNSPFQMEMGILRSPSKIPQPNFDSNDRDKNECWSHATLQQPQQSQQPQPNHTKQNAQRKIRKLKKVLEAIDRLDARKRTAGASLNDVEQTKLARREDIMQQLRALGE
jgi:hypothetical protein